jgi:hypothetical protein
LKEAAVIRMRLSVVMACAGAVAMALSGWAVLGGAASAAPTASTATPVMLAAGLAPSIPADPPIFGVTAGGLPWKITQGSVVLHTDGSLTASISGLVVTPGDKNPVPDLALSVFCNGTRAATTAAVAFSAQGNAQVVATVALPKLCPVPAVLINPATGKQPSDILTNIYIGFDGKA